MMSIQPCSGYDEYSAK